MKKKTIALILSCVLVLGCAIGGTFAWLTDKTASVVNTFTVGDVDIDLTETGAEGETNLSQDFKMIPGTELSKDPKVSVTNDSEDCWLFVKVEESSTLSKYISYGMVDGWTELTGDNIPSKVYYRKVLATDTVRSFSVIGYNKADGTFVTDKVLVKNGVTKQDMNDLGADDATQPTLTFTAYAVQLAGFENNPADAWAEANR